MKGAGLAEIAQPLATLVGLRRDDARAGDPAVFEQRLAVRFVNQTGITTFERGARRTRREVVLFQSVRATSRSVRLLPR